MNDLVPLDVNLSFTGDDLVTLVAVVIIGVIIVTVLKWLLAKI